MLYEVLETICIDGAVKERGSIVKIPEDRIYLYDGKIIECSYFDTLGNDDIKVTIENDYSKPYYDEEYIEKLKIEAKPTLIQRIKNFIKDKFI